MSNIEEDVKRQTKNTINYYKNLEKIEEIPIDILRAMYKDILAERKQDKARIKELEEKNKLLKYLYDDCCKCLLNTIEKQKVKDKIEELKKEYEIALEENSTKAFILKCKISALEELLEESK